MNRSERIEQAARAVLELGTNWQRIAEPLDKLRAALEPEVDWTTVPFGATVACKTGEVGKFVRMVNMCPQVLVSAGLQIHSPEDCTVESGPAYLYKYPWPASGERPNWIKDSDRVILSDQWMTAPKAPNHVDWERAREWFAVVQS
jgi:hypothetical protein